MNRENAKDYLPLVQALADGKVIQFKCGEGWEEIDRPMFNGDPAEWRIKPEPIGPDEFWVTVINGNVDAGPYTYEVTARDRAQNYGGQVVCYRRVEE